MMPLLLPIILPSLGAIAVILLPKNFSRVKPIISLFALGLNLFIVTLLFKENFSYCCPWLPGIWEFSLRIYRFSGFILLSLALFSLLISLYCWEFLNKRPYADKFYAYLLLNLAFASGAVLADNLLVLLFFWEGLLLTLFAMINLGNLDAYKAATKAFIIVAISDLCLLAGIALTGHLAGTLTLSQISLNTGGMNSLAFILLVVGAISKAGAMPFHSWIPDAADKAPLPFMALLPAAFEKLMGIYFLSRICLDLFKLRPHSILSYILMAIGSLTIILAVMMALIQKDYKRLLSYHAISQVGYMILGIGTALPVGIIGGLFHMINNALYKSCLFLTAGAVEMRSGITDLERLGGLKNKMPVTCGCFLITALSISGFPPFNGFFSKEIIYDAAKDAGLIFYVAALVGTFFTAISFLKLGHCVYFGKSDDAHVNIKEAPLAMLLPMILITLACICLGPLHNLALNKLILPVFQNQALSCWKFALNLKLLTLSMLVFLIAFLSHFLGTKIKGSPLKAVDYIHHAPILSRIYTKAEQGRLDPYNIGLSLVDCLAHACTWCDRKIDWLYDGLLVGLGYNLSQRIRRIENGSYSTYIIWCLAGLVLVTVYLMYSLY